jgi:oxazoline/thiazoline synthase
MLQHPRLHPRLHAEVVGQDLVLLLADGQTTTLEGVAFPQLVPLLDGTRTARQIVDALKGQLRFSDVLGALSWLEADGHVVNAEDLPPVGARSMQGDMVLPSLTDTGPLVPARIHTVGGLPSDLLRFGLDRLGIRPDPDWQFGLVLTDEYLRQEVAEFGGRCAAAGRPWLPVRPIGETVWVGPLVAPPATACWHSVTRRLAANRPGVAWLAARQRTAEPFPIPLSGDSKTLESALRAARDRLRSWTEGHRDDCDNPLLTIDSRGVATSHAVRREPSCPRCGTQVVSSWGGVRAGSPRHATVRSCDGGWRVRTPEETFRAYGHEVSPLTGIVHAMRCDPIGSGRPPVCLATYHHPIELSWAGKLRGHGLRRSAGKGRTLAEARAGVLCEALERYSGVFRGDEPRVQARLDSLDAPAILPNQCQHFSNAKFQGREAWNARAEEGSWVPPRFDPATLIDWTPLRSISHERQTFAPTAYCYYGYAPTTGEPCCRADSNGTAAGNTLEEAILHGFLELVERDAVALWWYNRVQRPAVDLGAFPNALRRLAGKLDDGTMQILDLTTDLRVPVFAALSKTASDSGAELRFGFGAHLDPEIALSRALTELAQLHASRGYVPDVAVVHSSSTDAAFLTAGNAKLPPPRWDGSVVPRADIRAGLRSCLEIAHARDLDVLVLDQTRGDVGLPVVRVVVPGLRHFWPRFGPGRLYDVPVGLGWLKAPREEAQLNPVHLTL